MTDSTTTTDFKVKDESNNAAHPQSQQMLPEMDDDIIDQDDLFNIMISTDNHLGYKENDKIRHNDSFLAFQEVLSM